ncbi:MAG: hypothetical protein ACOYN5_01470, partial [Bacteroidales bacterium]
MKNLSILLFLLFVSFTASSQSCLPQGITFSTQADVDNFHINYPNCTQIGGSVYIVNTSISNLNGLNVLTSIGGLLQIWYNMHLISLSGLDNVTQIGGALIIQYNFALTNLSGLKGLTQIGGDFTYFSNGLITNLSGLDKLTYVGGTLKITDCCLSSLTGLGKLDHIGGYLWLENNYALTNLSGLDSLNSIGNYLWIHNNYALTSLTGLDKLNSIGGGLTIHANHNIHSLSGLDNIDAGSITHLNIDSNQNLTVCTVQSICDYITSPTGFVSIHTNAIGCNNQAEVEAACAI